MTFEVRAAIYAFLVATFEDHAPTFAYSDVTFACFRETFEVFAKTFEVLGATFEGNQPVLIVITAIL